MERGDLLLSGEEEQAIRFCAEKYAHFKGKSSYRQAQVSASLPEGDTFPLITSAKALPPSPPGWQR